MGKKCVQLLGHPLTGKALTLHFPFSSPTHKSSHVDATEKGKILKAEKLIGTWVPDTVEPSCQPICLAIDFYAREINIYLVLITDNLDLSYSN